jgi:hypothetical protein
MAGHVNEIDSDDLEVKIEEERAQRVRFLRELADALEQRSTADAIEMLMLLAGPIDDQARRTAPLLR